MQAIKGIRNKLQLMIKFNKTCDEGELEVRRDQLYIVDSRTRKLFTTCKTWEPCRLYSVECFVENVCVLKYEWLVVVTKYNCIGQI